MSMGKLHAHVFKLIIIVLFESFALCQGAVCNAKDYGTPAQSDCMALFKKFTESQVLQARFFDEEQLRAESDYSWPGINNPFVPPIVQLPKYYSMSKSFHRPFSDPTHHP